MRKIGLGMVILACLLILGKTEAGAVATIGACGWCGDQCVRRTTGTVCTDVVPPAGQVCVEESGICVAKKTDGVCDWCGNQCVRKTAGMACADVMPPTGQTCVEESGVCVVKEVGIVNPTPVCKDRPACLDAKPPCYMPEPAEGWCQGVTPTNIPIPTQTICKTCAAEAKGFGDANCDGKIDLVDFSIWKTEYLDFAQITADFESYFGKWDADFNCDGKVDLVDFTIWKSGYLEQPIL